MTKFIVETFVEIDTINFRLLFHDIWTKIAEVNIHSVNIRISKRIYPGAHIQ